MKPYTHHNGQTLTIDGADIYYETHGSQNSPVLLFLHGGFGTIEEYNQLLEALPDSYYVIGIDSRGHGKSTMGEATLSYERIQHDVEAVLEHLQIRELSIVGFSDGGIVGFRLAALTHLTINKLITIGSSWHYDNILPMKDKFLKITSEFWQTKFPDTYQAYQALNPEPDFDTLTSSIIAMWVDETSSGHPNDGVDNISCPVLAIRGEHDPLVSSADLDNLAARVNNVDVAIIPDAGHEALQEQPQQCISLIIEQLVQQLA